MQALEEYQLTIVNRWGSTIYQSNNFAEPWTGTNVADGVYYYAIKYRTCNNEQKQLKGWVQVIR